MQKYSCTLSYKYLKCHTPFTSPPVYSTDSTHHCITCYTNSMNVDGHTHKKNSYFQTLIPYLIPIMHAGQFTTQLSIGGVYFESTCAASGWPEVIRVETPNIPNHRSVPVAPLTLKNNPKCPCLGTLHLVRTLPLHPGTTQLGRRAEDTACVKILGYIIQKWMDLIGCKYVVYIAHIIFKGSRKRRTKVPLTWLSM